MGVPTHPTQRGGRRRKGERGTVTAEAAVVLPLIALFVLTLLWLLTLGITKVETVDAARDAARSLARGDDAATVEALARRTTSADAEVFVASSGRTVTVTVSVRTQPPGWLLVNLPAVTVSSTATTLEESRTGGSLGSADAAP